MVQLRQGSAQQEVEILREAVGKVTDNQLGDIMWNHIDFLLDGRISFACLSFFKVIFRTVVILCNFHM